MVVGDSRGVTVIGHRGASHEAPENSMAAFGRALELGANGIEFDVQLTRDGHAVVIHDAMLDRTTTGSGPVLEASVDDVRSVDAGGWFGEVFEGEQVPLLDEVLALPARASTLPTSTPVPSRSGSQSACESWDTWFTRTMPLDVTRSSRLSTQALSRSPRTMSPSPCRW